jgi:hypothetical protein
MAGYLADMVLVLLLLVSAGRVNIGVEIPALHMQRVGIGFRVYIWLARRVDVTGSLLKGNGGGQEVLDGENAVVLRSKYSMTSETKLASLVLPGVEVFPTPPS